jgi:fatty-acyl-CoA synthase
VRHQLAAHAARAPIGETLLAVTRTRTHLRATPPPTLNTSLEAPMHSYAHGTSAVPLLGETIGANLARTVERVGDSEALVVRSQGYRATYRELWEQTSDLARALLDIGIRTGDRVSIWAPNRFEWVVTQYATARIGAILVNINPAYKPPELQYALTRSGVRLLLLARGFRNSDYVGMLAEVRANCPALRETVVLEEGWEALLARAPRTPGSQLAACEAALQFDDAINIQYTSGTTGFP